MQDVPTSSFRDEKKHHPHALWRPTNGSCCVRDFYKDESFCRDRNGNINLWRLYNLFTRVNKNSYIDSFLERSVNAFSLTEEIK